MLLRANPLESIENLGRIDAVMLQGSILNREVLDVAAIDLIGEFHWNDAMDHHGVIRFESKLSLAMLAASRVVFFR